MKTMKAGMLALCLFAIPGVASAQQLQWTDRGYVSVNLGGQAGGSQDLSTSQTFTKYDETATLSSTQQVKPSGGVFDFGGAYRVWGRNLLAGASFTSVGSKGDATITGSIPDPVFTDRPRPVSATATDLDHRENVLHLVAVWMMPVANKLDVGFFAGPSIFFVKQNIASVAESAVVEPGPAISSVTVTRESKTAVGFNLGVDVQYMVAKHWGVGGIARFTRASVSLPGASEKLSVGGFQIGGGARLRF